jgi:hypothetical protein
MVAEGAVDTPVPLRLTVCGLFCALSMKVSAPVRVPEAVGVKVTFTVQVVPEANEAGQLLVCVKSPLTCTLLIVNAAFPLLLRVTV